MEQKAVQHVHNHGPSEGLGFDCPEVLLPDGSFMGACRNKAGLMNDLQLYLEGDTPTARAAQERMDRTAKAVSLFDEQMAKNRADLQKALETTMVDSDFLLERSRYWENAMDITKKMGQSLMERNDPNDYTTLVKDMVRVHIESQLRPGIDTLPPYQVYVVWFCKTLQNWKAICCTTMLDGMLYEVTHNGDKRETYIDAYRKQSNTVIPD
jgi:hypothetical protein